MSHETNNSQVTIDQVSEEFGEFQTALNSLENEIAKESNIKELYDEKKTNYKVDMIKRFTPEQIKNFTDAEQSELYENTNGLHSYLKDTLIVSLGNKEELRPLKTKLVSLQENMNKFNLKLKKHIDKKLEDLDKKVPKIEEKGWMGKTMDAAERKRDGMGKWGKRGIVLTGIGAVLAWIIWWRKKRKKKKEKAAENNTESTTKNEPGFFKKRWVKAVGWTGAIVGTTAVAVLGVKNWDKIKGRLGLSDWFESKEEKEKGQKEAENLASQVEGVSFNKDKDQYEYGIYYDIGRFKIKTVEDLQNRKAKMIEKANEGNQVPLENVREKIQNKLKENPQYTNQCKTIGKSINTFYEKYTGGNFNALGSEDYEYLENKDKLTPALIVAQMDMGYPPISNLLNIEFLRNIEELTEPSKWDKVCFAGQQFAYKQMADTLSLVDSNFKVIDNFADAKSEDLRQHIIDIQTKYADTFKNLKSIFAKQMQVPVYIQHVQRRFEYKLVEKHLSKNETGFNKLNDTKKDELIRDKLENETFMQENIDGIVQTHLLNNTLASIANPENPYFELFDEILKNPLDPEVEKVLKESHSDQESLMTDIEKQNTTFDAKESEKLASSFISTIQDVGAKTRYSAWSESMGTLFNTQGINEEEFLKGTNFKDTFDKFLIPANNFLGKVAVGQKPTQEEFTQFKQAVDGYYEVYNQLVLGANVKQEAIKDGDSLAVRYVMSFESLGKGAWDSAVEIWQTTSGWECAGYCTAGVVATGLSADVLTRAPRKFLKTSGFLLTKAGLKSQKGVKSIKLFSLTDKTLSTVTNLATQKVSLRIRPRYATKRMPFSKLLYAGPTGKELLTYDFLHGRLSPKRAAQIATDFRLFDKSATMSTEKLLEKMTTCSIEESKLIAKYADHGILKKGIIDFTKDSGFKPFRRIEKKTTQAINKKALASLQSLDTFLETITDVDQKKVLTEMLLSFKSLDDLNLDKISSDLPTLAKQLSSLDTTDLSKKTIASTLDEGKLTKLMVGGTDILDEYMKVTGTTLDQLNGKYPSIFTQYEKLNYIQDHEKLAELDKKFAQQLIDEANASAANKQIFLKEMLAQGKIKDGTELSDLMKKIKNVDMDLLNETGLEKLIKSSTGGTTQIIDGITEVNKFKLSIEKDLDILYTKMYTDIDTQTPATKFFLKAEADALENVKSGFKSLSLDEKNTVQGLRKFFGSSDEFASVMGKIASNEISVVDDAGKPKAIAKIADELGLAGKVDDFKALFKNIPDANFFKLLKIGSIASDTKFSKALKIINIIV